MSNNFPIAQYWEIFLMKLLEIFLMDTLHFFDFFVIEVYQGFKRK